jgi:hypothetical protein
LQYHHQPCIHIRSKEESVSARQQSTLRILFFF